MRHALPLISVVLGSVVAVAQPVSATADLPASLPAAGEALRPLVVRAKPDPAARVVRRLPLLPSRPPVPDRPRSTVTPRQGRTLAAICSAFLDDPTAHEAGYAPTRSKFGRSETAIAGRSGSKSRRIEVRLWVTARPCSVRPSLSGAPARRRLWLRFLCPVSVRPDRPLLRRVRARGARAPVPAHGLAGRGHRRHPRHEPAGKAAWGYAASQGCRRVDNDIARRLRRLAPLGTTIDIIR